MSQNFRMHQLDDETRERIRALVVGYTDLLECLVRETKPPKGKRSELHEYYFKLFAELLCLRDEDTEFLKNGSDGSKISILDTPALRNYESLYAYLASETEFPTRMVKPSDDEPIRLCENTVRLCRRGLHSFGTRNVRGEDIEPLAWLEITKRYIPCVDPVELRQAYYKYISSRDEVPLRLPERWSLEEDYAVFDNVSRFGRGELGVRSIYSVLGERRSYDEIVERIHVIYPNKTRTYNTKKRKHFDHVESFTPSLSPRSDWSIDDSLLLVND